MFVKFNMLIINGIRLMNKSVLVGFGAFVTALSYAAIYLPNSILPFIINPSKGWTIARLVLVFVLIAYGLFEIGRRRSTQMAIRFMGVGILMFCLFGLFSPDTVGLSGFYLLPIDLIVLLEGGIAALLLSLDLPLHESAYRSNRAFDANYYHSWLRQDDKAQPNSLTPAL